MVISALPSLIPREAQRSTTLSSRISEEERARHIADILAKVEQGAIPVGGFISPGEREVATKVAEMPRARMIKLIPWGLKRYKPGGAEATRWLADGRLLILTGFPDDEPEECRRMNCLKNNEWVKQICSRNQCYEAIS